MASPKEVPLPPVSLGITVTEDLPFPVVHYPNHYGTFIAFSKDNQSQAYLCACARSAVENYLKLRPLHYPNSTFQGLSNAPLSKSEFPDIIAEMSRSLSFQNGTNESLFVPSLCHRCNMKTPSVRWCHEMYGVTFVQYYGWYINQTCFRIGIFPGVFSSTYLQEVCPDDLKQDIEAAKMANEKYHAEEMRILEMVGSPKREDIPEDEVTYLHNVRMDEAKEYIELRREASQYRRKFTSRVENMVRTEFGFKKVGEGWVSETLLYNLIVQLYPNHTIIRHHRPDWLGRLELDIYLPEMRLAFEYQGQQHFHAIKAWGGERALLDLQARDRVKAEICSQNGIALVAIDYTEPLTEGYLREVISQELARTLEVPIIGLRAEGGDSPRPRNSAGLVGLSQVPESVLTSPAAGEPRAVGRVDAVQNRRVTPTS